ncbi:hypothetical protein [Candidatus Aquicultor secundus]|nr:hypothetical protein [Candidatus Aquicultor secundus]
MTFTSNFPENSMPLRYGCPITSRGEGAVPSDQFFDISHTFDSGGQTFR